MNSQADGWVARSGSEKVSFNTIGEKNLEQLVKRQLKKK